MSVTRISDTLDEFLRDELEYQVLEGEEVTWDATVLPGDNKAPILFITIGMPGPLLGTMVQVGIFLPNPAFLSQKEIADAVRSLLEVVRQQRSQQLQNPPELPPGAAATMPQGGVLLG